MKSLRYVVCGALGLSLLGAVPAMARTGGDRDDHRAPAARVETRVETRGEVRHDDDRDHRDLRNDRDDHERDEHDRFDRDDRRVVIVTPPPAPAYVNPVYVNPLYVSPDTDVNVQLCDVPACVVDTATRQNLGAIASTQFVRRDGHEFYRFIESARGQTWDVRVATNGGLLGIDRC